MRRLRRVSTTALPPGMTPPIKAGFQEAPKRGGGEDAFMKPPTVEGEMGLSKPVPDQRFATYFGNSSLHSVRPLRQERRHLRNRAIFMAVLACIFLYWVIKTIASRFGSGL